ncbi:MAG: hypothetical protein KAG66_23510, partial [Methylococcales bacterium]|nr:hypothetical protein [Methylococcales bacterium]
YEKGLVLLNPDVSTVGGYITSAFGRLPEAGETIDTDGFHVEVTVADSRSIREVRFERLEKPQSKGDEGKDKSKHPKGNGE